MPDPKARSRARESRVNGVAKREQLQAALHGLHLKPGDLGQMFRCSRGMIKKLTARPDFPRPFSLTDDDHNLRFVYDEVVAYRDAHRRAITELSLQRSPRPRRGAEEAVRAGLAALRGGGTATNFR